MSKRRESILNPMGGARVGPAIREERLDAENIHQFDGFPAQPKPYSPKNWKRPNDTLYGYTGFQEHKPEEHVLDEPLTKYVIRGYSGFIPTARNVCGSAAIPTQQQQIEKQKLTAKRKEYYNKSKSPRSADRSEQDEEDGLLFPDTGRQGISMQHFREYTRNLDLAERYEQAVERIMARGQTQEMLLRMVKAKISERVKSYSEQRVSLRKLFEAFDFNGDGVLDEMEFRECLERCNIQFDDSQVLALFAYFDGNYNGFIQWENFAEHASVVNPRGGTAVQPKQITATFKYDNWENVGVSKVGR